MPRQARQKSETGIYHVMARGIGQQDIFYDEEDMQKYLDTFIKVSSENRVCLLGYCLMSNHVHMLVKEESTNISAAMKRIGVSYAYWYNWKYKRTGHVFQDRFKSEPVETDAYLLTVIRYIHHNPIKASLVNKPHEYKWSSCAAYYEVHGQTNGPDSSLILSIMNSDRNDAIQAFRIFVEEPNNDYCLDYEESKRINDFEVHELIKLMMKGRPVLSLLSIESEETRYWRSSEQNMVLACGKYPGLPVCRFT